jgi:hypothetical protein
MGQAHVQQTLKLRLSDVSANAYALFPPTLQGLRRDQRAEAPLAPLRGGR